MVKLSEVRTHMQKLAKEDRERRTVQVSGATIEDALEQAAIELGLNKKHLEYELISPSANGFFGYGKKDCIIIAYEVIKDKIDNSNYDNFADDLEGFGLSKYKIIDKNGEAIIKNKPEGVFIKINPPLGNGKKLSEKEAISIIRKRGVDTFEKSILSIAVKNADGELIRIADYNHNPINDASINVEIDDQEMTAKINIKEPGIGGADVTSEAILGAIRAAGVTNGILEKDIRNLADHPIYNKAIVVAKGSKAINGNDAKINYTFKVDNKHVDLKERQGKVDFKEVNNIKNVVKGQILARKIPLEQGKTGNTVTGKMLTAKKGQDVDFNLGQNVRISEDGLSVTAEINGQVMLSKGKLSVAPVYVVEGDVNLKSGGNVIFLGSVIVKGSVEDGFKVKASGNIEILGNVGKAEIDADGEVLVHQGINGKMEGRVRAGKRVCSKFIENVNVEANKAVVATDGIINSNVVSQGVISCMGKRATIVGGRLRATEEIHAKIIGSATGSETILEVGWDPKSKEKLDKLESRFVELKEKYEELTRNQITLENYKKKKKELPDEKEEYLQELKEEKIKIQEEMHEDEKKIEKVKTYLESLEYVGKISASNRVHTGVRIYIKDAFLKVRTEFNRVTFKNEGGDVKVVKYEPFNEDLTE